MNNFYQQYKGAIERFIDQALQEDIEGHDHSSLACFDAALQRKAELKVKEDCVIAGISLAEKIFKHYDPSLSIEIFVPEGEILRSGAVAFNVSGNAQSVLATERLVLNCMQRMSGIATKTHHFNSLIKHTSAKLLDTRKTLPGLRTAQKYAVKAGGCFNHRFGLYDAYLIKENHINACGSIELAVSTARQANPRHPVEVEVESLSQLDTALQARADVIMLDNFTLEQLSEAVQLNAGRAKLEASGGISNETLVAIAETGVDYISLGTLTKDCKAVDLSLLFA